MSNRINNIALAFIGVAGSIGTFVTVIWGQQLGEAVQAAVVAICGVITAIPTAHLAAITNYKAQVILQQAARRNAPAKKQA